MSVKLMAMVFYATGLTSTQKIVMLALADHANEEGRSIYPSVARLCEKTALKERVVRRTMVELRAKDGLHLLSVTKHATPTTPNEYAINIGRLAELSRTDRGALSAPGAPDADRGAPDADRGALSAPKSPLTTKEPSKDITPETDKKLTHQQEMVGTLCEVMRMDVKLNAKRVATFAAELFKLGATPEQVREKYGPGSWWYRFDWRGQKDQAPNQAAIRETWGNWRETKPNGNRPTLNGSAVVRGTPAARKPAAFNVKDARRAGDQ